MKVCILSLIECNCYLCNSTNINWVVYSVCILLIVSIYQNDCISFLENVFWECFWSQNNGTMGENILPKFHSTVETFLEQFKDFLIGDSVSVFKKADSFLEGTQYQHTQKSLRWTLTYFSQKKHLAICNPTIRNQES